MNKNNENMTWVMQNHYSLTGIQFLSFQDRVGEIFSAAVNKGEIITINQARKQAIQEKEVVE
jgi:hypothetical protein